MENDRALLDRFYRCTDKMDGLYYLAARRLGVKENALALLYTLNDGIPRSQKQLAQELLIPKTTVNTIVKEYLELGYLRLVSSEHGREKEMALTPLGRSYAQEVLRPVYRAEEQALRRTLERFSPQFVEAVEALTGYLAQEFQREIFAGSPVSPVCPPSPAGEGDRQAEPGAERKEWN